MLYNLTADPNEHIDLSNDFPDVLQALHRRVISKYWSKMIRARVAPIDSSAFPAWRRGGGFVGPWHNTNDTGVCSSITDSRRLFEAEAGLGNCSHSNTTPQTTNHPGGWVDGK